MTDRTEVRRHGEAKMIQRMRTSSDVVLICPNETHRRTLLRALGAQQASVISDLTLYPAYNHLLAVIDLDCDAFLIEIDTDTDVALDLVETICTRKPSSTVMVYSANQESELLMSSMRAGAREFLSGSIPPAMLSEALLRASVRRAEMADRGVRGKILVFWGAKGGCGVTTLATNFALALRHETGGPVALLDLHPHLGDVALLLGLTPQFTIAEALTNPDRLDKEFVSTLMTNHRSSGLSVMAAPDMYNSAPVDGGTVGNIVDLVGTQFPFVVVDASRTLGEGAAPVFQIASTIYLVTQADVPSLRNCQRFVSYLKGYGEPNIELVLNRSGDRRSSIDEEQLAKTIGLAPKWKVPNDYAAVRRAADTGIPVGSERGAVGESLRRMARAACGKLQENNKKRGGLFG
jgi:pilus assembly protein CpaE